MKSSRKPTVTHDIEIVEFYVQTIDLIVPCALGSTNGLFFMSVCLVKCLAAVNLSVIIASAIDFIASTVFFSCQ